MKELINVDDYYKVINGVGYTLRLSELVTVITLLLGYGNTNVDGAYAYKIKKGKSI